MNTHGNMDFCDLYEEYRESQVVLLPVKPYLIYVYWDVTSNDIEKAKQRLGGNYGHSKAVLRFYDVTDIIYDGTNAHDFFDVEIDLQSRDWYVDIWSPDKSYFVDLGFKTGDGFFLSLARSGVARTPCAWPASKVDEHYMLVAEDEEKGLSKIRVPGEPVRDELIEYGKAQAGDEIRRSEPLKEEERTKEDKNARPINLPQNIHGGIQAQFEKGRYFDLTEMSEKGFTFGISSELISSRNGNNDSVDCA
jgi:hypothetical protein